MKLLSKKHTSILCAFVCLTLSLIFITTVHAQDVDSEATIPTRERGKEALERQEARTERRTEMAVRMQERVINLVSNVTTRLEAAIRRMEQIIVRIETRIEKLKALGVATESAESMLALAKTSLEQARETLSGIPSVHDAISGLTPKEAYVPIRAQLLSVRESLKKAQGNLLETVALLKQAVRDAEVGRKVSEAVKENQLEEPATDTEE